MGHLSFDAPRLAITTYWDMVFCDRWEDGDMIFNGVHYDCYLDMNDYDDLMNHTEPLIRVYYLNSNHTKAYVGDMTLNSEDSTPVYIMEHTDNTNQIKDLLLRCEYITQEKIDNCTTEEELLNLVFYEGVDEDGFANWSGDFLLSREYAVEIKENYDSLSGQVFHFDEHFKIVNEPTLDRVILSNGVKNIHYTNIRYPDGFTLPSYVEVLQSSAFARSEFSSITLPEGLPTIPEFMCYENFNLTSITIPNSITSIGNKAFHNNQSLSSVTIPQTVTDIGEEAFSSCESLTSISFPDDLEFLDERVFLDCSALTSITIPPSLTTLYMKTFNGCTSLSEVVLHDSLNSIGQEIFKGCTSLTTITIPSSVTHIDSSAFEDCDNLTAIHYYGTATGFPWGATHARHYYD